MDTTRPQTACALCDDPIALIGDSAEHIIPNSIGGRRKIWGFICKDCNSRAGDSWDAEIWRQFSNVAMMHGVKRDRGEPPSIKVQTVDGKRYWLLPDGNLTIERPTFSAEPGEEGLNITVTARDEKEAQRMAKEIANKYPKFEPQSFMKAAIATETPLESPVTFSSSFGGQMAGRSMVKTAVAMAVAAGVSAQACDAAMIYLKDQVATPSYAFFYIRDLIADRPTSHAFNCVSVVGDPSRGRLLGYVEYFSLCRIVVILSENYEGEPIRATYAFNPADGNVLDMLVDLDLSDVELDLVRTNNATSDKAHFDALNAGFGAIYRRGQLRQWERATEEAFEYACKALDIPLGGVVEPAQAADFAAQMVKYLGPMISRMARR